MTKGRYADKTRTRREAEARYAGELRESDRLRARLHELRSLEGENRRLREALDTARDQAAQGSSDRVVALEIENAVLEGTVSGLTLKIEKQIAAYRHDLAVALDLLGQAGDLYGRSSAWYELVAAFLDEVCDSPNHVDGDGDSTGGRGTALLLARKHKKRLAGVKRSSRRMAIAAAGGETIDGIVSAGEGQLSRPVPLPEPES
jgi:hypothetical protein